MSESLVFLSESLIRSIFRINERFAQKIDEQIPSPALQYTTYSTLYSLYSAHAAQVVLTSLIVYRNHCVSNLVLRPLMSGIVLNHFPLCFLVNMVPKIASQVSTKTCLWEVMGLSPEILPQLSSEHKVKKIPWPKKPTGINIVLYNYIIYIIFPHPF